ncbi:MAG: YdjY domain-containing protein [Finegoldia magna]|uniref:YdjY domain-containing protein n=1 Tax=Finegoldia magna TaxID=1260 RepID=UPI000B9174FA|nr:YdjY domain-containing protein [Finegoldia magna]MDU1009650.1 YdjY domain-containing protein [Finegoldia magna]MDU1087971.1 YdjY domain-containing protein [Finegoldia magna]MDU3192671.1 YdjY domain-containing protein [Finegoldia magna]MDU7889852.1 YdjY domain-containing protein [Finegoldia magna]MDU7925693.1 YdjY domain-containing protein [Finegoldia magna]
MNLRKKLVAGFLCLAIVGLAGCSQKADDKKEETNNTQTTEQAKDDSKKEENKEEKKADDEVNGVSLKNPIKVDKEAKKITVLSSVNGKYFTEATRHASVNTDGSNGAKSVLTAYATPEEFYNALIEIGAKPGENMNPDNATTTHVEGSKIGATVTWEGAGKDYDINEVIKDSNGKKIDFRFGGNLERAKTKKTGCLTCLDSCPVGIISNTTYTYGAVEKRNEVKFTGNADVLPEDGTYVAVTYTLED